MRGGFMYARVCVCVCAVGKIKRETNRERTH